jgi:hypothetical protein
MVPCRPRAVLVEVVAQVHFTATIRQSQRSRRRTITLKRPARNWRTITAGASRRTDRRWAASGFVHHRPQLRARLRKVVVLGVGLSEVKNDGGQ